MPTELEAHYIPLLPPVNSPYGWLLHSLAARCILSSDSSAQRPIRVEPIVATAQRISTLDESRRLAYIGFTL